MTDSGANGRLQTSTASGLAVAMRSLGLVERRKSLDSVQEFMSSRSTGYLIYSVTLRERCER